MQHGAGEYSQTCYIWLHWQQRTGPVRKRPSNAPGSEDLDPGIIDVDAGARLTAGAACGARAHFQKRRELHQVLQPARPRLVLHNLVVANPVRQRLLQPVGVLCLQVAPLPVTTCTLPSATLSCCPVPLHCCLIRCVHQLQYREQACVHGSLQPLTASLGKGRVPCVTWADQRRRHLPSATGDSAGALSPLPDAASRSMSSTTCSMCASRASAPCRTCKHGACCSKLPEGTRNLHLCVGAPADRCLQQLLLQGHISCKDEQRALIAPGQPEAAIGRQICDVQPALQ